MARLLTLLALWLPLQSVAAFVMPFCGHDTISAPTPTPTLMQASGMATAGCPHAGHPPADSAPTPDDNGHRAAQSCDACGLCHLAAANAIPAVPPALPGRPDTHDFASSAGPMPSSFIPEQPQRPPRSPA